jgi:hypothetical protein
VTRDQYLQSGDFQIDVHIRRMSDDVVHVYRDVGFYGEDGHFREYIWRDGNYACDCNRANFFDGRYAENNACGHGRFVIDKIVRVDTGAIVYKDDI